MEKVTESKTLVVGEHPELGRVTLEMEITHHGPDVTTEGEPITYKTVDLEPVTEYDELTISGTCRNSCGQIDESIRENLDGFTKLYIPRTSLDRILDIWKEYHLGGLNAGTRKQSEYLGGINYDYTQACGALQRAGLLEDRGYKYGSAWLKSSLPALVGYEITGLFSAGFPQPTEPAEGTLDAFITKHGIKFECHRVDKRPDGLWDYPEQQDARHFRCRITGPLLPFEKSPSSNMGRKNTRSFGFYFSQGSAHTSDPTLADVLDCLASDASGYENARTFEEWASEYGYETDSRKAEKMYRTVKRQAAQLKRTLGEEAYQELLWNTDERRFLLRGRPRR